VQKHCAAHRAGTALELPRKKARRKTVLLDEPCAWVRKGGKVLLEQQTGPRWRGLWKLPKHSHPGTDPLVTLDYPFTHHRVTLTVHHAPAPVVVPEHHEWHAIKTLADVPLAAPHRRAVEQLLKLGTTKDANPE
jgi:A/G-specific adenine glycosylase